ncbi:hypothetical protein FHW01_004164 [Ochrobactrum sp. RH1CCR134]|nr:hypothetical protein [Ochrobactrum sp. RH1CCR134]
MIPNRLEDFYENEASIAMKMLWTEFTLLLVKMFENEICNLQYPRSIKKKYSDSRLGMRI